MGITLDRIKSSFDDWLYWMNGTLTWSIINLVYAYDGERSPVYMTVGYFNTENYDSRERVSPRCSGIIRARDTHVSTRSDVCDDCLIRWKDYMKMSQLGGCEIPITKIKET